MNIPKPTKLITMRFSGLAIFGIPPLLNFEKFYQHYMCRTGRETFRAQITSSACRSGPRNTESTNKVACLFRNFVRDLLGTQRVLHCFPRLAGSVWQHFMCVSLLPAQTCTGFPRGADSASGLGTGPFRRRWNPLGKPDHLRTHGSHGLAAGRFH